MFHGTIKKIIVASFMDQGTLKVILFFNSALASAKTKNIQLLYLNTDLSLV